MINDNVYFTFDSNDFDIMEIIRNLENLSVQKNQYYNYKKFWNLQK